MSEETGKGCCGNRECKAFDSGYSSNCKLNGFTEALDCQEFIKEPTMPDQGKGPARVVEAPEHGDNMLVIYMVPCGQFENQKDAENVAKEINKVLAPLTRKADLCGRFAKAQFCPHCENVGYTIEQSGAFGEPEMHQCEWCYTTPDSFFNIKAEFDREA